MSYQLVSGFALRRFRMAELVAAPCLTDEARPAPTPGSDAKAMTIVRRTFGELHVRQYAHRLAGLTGILRYAAGDLSQRIGEDGKDIKDRLCGMHKWALPVEHGTAVDAGEPTHAGLSGDRAEERRIWILS